MKRISKSRKCERTSSLHLRRNLINNNIRANLFSKQTASFQQQQVIDNNDYPMNDDLLIDNIFDENVSQQIDHNEIFVDSIFSNENNLYNEIDVEKESYIPNYDEKIYIGSQLLSREASLYVFAFSHRHNLTRVAAEDLVKMIRFLLPNPNNFPKTMFSLEKLIGFEKTDISIKEYCQICRLEYFIGPLNREQKETEFCGCLNNEERRFDNFLYTNVYDKITYLVKQHFDTIHKYCSSQRSSQDIFDGEFYKKMAKENTLHLMVCADGTPIRKSSKMKEFWPVILSLIELPRSLRDSIKNKIISGILFLLSKMISS
jgi:hypothetical protein